MDGFLFQAFVYLTAAVVAVPIARRLGLGSVLGYLIAGVVIGPLLGLVGSETEDLQHFAEFGVVMMLFLVGLELEPKALWAMRARLLGLGGLQVALTTGLVAVAAMAFGQPWRFALAAGLVLALSSTAIVLQTLQEKGLMKSEGGQASFSVLLFQDIAVIPMLALIPLLAAPELIAQAAGAAGDAANAGAAVAGDVAGGAKAASGEAAGHAAGEAVAAGTAGGARWRTCPAGRWRWSTSARSRSSSSAGSTSRDRSFATSPSRTSASCSRRRRCFWSSPSRC